MYNTIVYRLLGSTTDSYWQFQTHVHVSWIIWGYSVSHWLSRYHNYMYVVVVFLARWSSSSLTFTLVNYTESFIMDQMWVNWVPLLLPLQCSIVNLSSLCMYGTINGWVLTFLLTTIVNAVRSTELLMQLILWPNTHGKVYLHPVWPSLLVH